VLSLQEIGEWLAVGLECVGVLIIVGGIIHAVIAWFRGERLEGDSSAYAFFRRQVGRAIILGLEFLVAGDIIHTVAAPLTFESLGLLAILILIRSFLSIEIEMELDGRWPWKKDAPAAHDSQGS
jgi:uncharacterized membrane protein